MTLWHFASCTAIFFEHLQRIVRVGGGGGVCFQQTPREITDLRMMGNSSSCHMKVLDNNSEAREPHLDVGCSKCTASFKFGLHIIYKESRTDVIAFKP